MGIPFPERKELPLKRERMGRKGAGQGEEGRVLAQRGVVYFSTIAHENPLMLRRPTVMHRSGCLGHDPAGWRQSSKGKRAASSSASTLPFVTLRSTEMSFASPCDSHHLATGNISPGLSSRIWPLNMSPRISRQWVALSPSSPLEWDFRARAPDVNVVVGDIVILLPRCEPRGRMSLACAGRLPA